MSRTVLTLIPDLFFAARIRETAKSAGIDVGEATADGLAAHAVERSPDLVLVDLHGVGAIDAVRAVRAVAPKLPIVGFCSHVDRALQSAALEAGASRVLPRSALTRDLAAILVGAGGD
jgi:DNA-binding NarL/FixJ family response regulator